MKCTGRNAHARNEFGGLGTLLRCVHMHNVILARNAGPHVSGLVIQYLYTYAARLVTCLVPATATRHAGRA